MRSVNGKIFYYQRLFLARVWVGCVRIFKKCPHACDGPEASGCQLCRAPGWLI